MVHYLAVSGDERVGVEGGVADQHLVEEHADLAKQVLQKHLDFRGLRFEKRSRYRLKTFLIKQLGMLIAALY